MEGKERRGQPPVVEDKRGTVAPRGRRRSDHFRVAPGENWYRDVILCVVCIFVFISLNNSDGAIDRVREGRALAIRVMCGATNATINAGRAQITGGSAGVPDKLASFLEAHGYPPKGLREKQAKVAANLYAQSISKGVLKTTGGEARGLVDPTGALRCDKLVAESVLKVK